ncbi:MAG TPA: TonB-dependent receptor [Candidatus Eisenbacteria bacterium]|jgi:hypothetical protein
MHPFLRRPVPAVILLALLAVPAHAQDRGTISGRVRDKKTGHAIPFATVTVVGAQRGGLTDSEGQYLVPGVPGGTFEVRVQFLGFRPESKPGVVVTPGKVVVADFDLEEIVVREEKVVEVTAERRLVEVKQGATIRSVSAAEIRNLPVQTIGDVLQQQAGISTDADQIHVRGGRADETVFVVNGVANRDLVTGQSTAGQLNARSVAEVNVATGAYDVRYGNALSGVVEIKLKEGSDKLATGITTSSGSYGGRMFQLVVGGPDPFWKPLFGLARVKLPGSLSTILDVSGQLYETRFRYLDAANRGVYHSMFEPLFTPSSYRHLHSSYEDQFLGYHFKYGDFFSPSQDNRWSLRYGLTWKPSTNDKWNFNYSKRIAIDQGFSRTLFSATGDVGDPAYPWLWAHNIEHAPTFFEDNVQTSLEWRRTLSTTSYLNFQVSRYFFAQRQDVLGKLWADYVQPDDKGIYTDSITVGTNANGDPIKIIDPRHDDFFQDSGDDDTWQDRRSSSWGFQGSMVRRYRRHELEMGFEHELQTVQYLTIQDPWIADPDGLGDSHDLWRVHPWVGDLYVRDRLDYEGFTGNVGVRADYWFLGREAENAVGDPGNPNITSATRTRFYEETHSFFGRRYKLKFSPRVIVAHPITENSSFFFNYGQFTQNPSYRFVYSKLNSISSESFPLLGNPNLNPQVSVNYEVGAKHQLMPRAAANVTFFVKDVYDYPVATTFSRLSGSQITPFFVYLNGHFARSRGFEVELEKRRSRLWSGKITYTYQQTKGKSSDPNEQKVVQENGGDASETRLSETYVRWNRPHKLAANLDLRFDKEAPLGVLRNFGVNLYIQGTSGRAYTPSNPLSTQAAEPNSKNGPFQITTDVRLNRAFPWGDRRLDVSFTGTNVFSNYIVNRVDPVSGRGRVWGVGSYDPDLFPNTRGDHYLQQQQVDDPSNYGPGAQWRVALDYDF